MGGVGGDVGKCVGVCICPVGICPVGICPVGICPVGICPGVFVLESVKTHCLHNGQLQ